MTDNNLAISTLLICFTIYNAVAIMTNDKPQSRWLVATILAGTCLAALLYMGVMK